MAPTHVWGEPTNNNGSTSYPNSAIHSDGIPMPIGNPDIFGRRVIRLLNIAIGYATGATGITPYLVYQGVVTGGYTTFNDSGGTARFQINHGSGRMYFGRDERQPGVVVDQGDGGTWGGRLAGAVNWVTVPTPPGLRVSRTKRDIQVIVTPPGSDGGAGVTAYAVQLSRNGAAWSDQRGGGSTTYLNLSPGSYRFRTWAINEAGQGSAAESGTFVVPDVPSAPSGITAVRDARSVRVTVGSVASTGGAAVSGYYTQHSADGGKTWSDAVLAPDRVYTYSDLTAGTSYLFRGFARNEIGDSPSATTPALFVPAGGRRWDTASASWKPTATARRWDTTTNTWKDLQTAKRWDSTTQSWKDLT